MKPLLYLICTLICNVTSSYGVDYFPLAVGNKWKYRGRTDRSDEIVTITIKEKTVVDSGTLFSGSISTIVPVPDSVKATLPDSIKDLLRDSIPIGSFIEIAIFRDYYSSGNDIFAIDTTVTGPGISSQWKLFEHIPDVNSTWGNSDESGGSIIINYGAVTVPAGTFQSCYAVVQTDYKDTTWYAPDVGMVASADYELISYTVKSTGTSSKQITVIPVSGNYHSNRYSLIDPLGRCVKSSAAKSQGVLRNVSQGMYFYYNRSNIPSDAANGRCILALHLH